MQFNIPAEHKNASGVYIIRNTMNGKVYVGSAVRFWKRFIGHRRALRLGIHHSVRLQRFVNKHGLDTLIVSLLELSNPENNLICEQKWMDYYKAYVRETGYNTAPLSTSCLGVKHSPETKAKISAAFKDRVFSEEHRRRISEAKRGVPMSPEFREMARQSALKRPPRSVESLAKFVGVMKGRKQSQSHIEKRMRAHTGRKRPPETGRKISEKAKGRTHTEEAKLRMSAARKGVPHSEEHRRKLSEAAKKRWANKLSQQLAIPTKPDNC